jgi:hypothetical protein
LQAEVSAQEVWQVLVVYGIQQEDELHQTAMVVMGEWYNE